MKVHPRFHMNIFSTIDKTFLRKWTNKLSSRAENQLGRIQPVSNDDAALLVESLKSANAVHGGKE